MIKYYCDRCNKQMASKEYGQYEIRAAIKYRQDTYNLCKRCSEYITKQLQEVDE